MKPAYLQLARVSNLPTVVSNALVGLAIGSGIDGIPLRSALLTVPAVALLYTGGMVLNDVADVRIDRMERPERPLPSGRASVGGALALAVVCFAGALALLGFAGPFAFAAGAALLACVVTYDLLHTLLPRLLAAGLMGLCRMMVYAVAAASVAWPASPFWLAGFGGALLGYTAVVTLIAHRETRPGPAPAAHRALAALLPIAALAPAVVTRPLQPGYAVAAAAVLLAWLLFALRPLFRAPADTRRVVMSLIAGMALVDAYYLSLLDRPALALAAGGLFVATLAGQRRIAGT